MRIKPIFSIVGPILALLILNACTTMQTVPANAKAVRSEYETGDRIRIYTKDDTIITFDVVEITPEAIVGMNERIPFSDIAKIEKKEISVANTAVAGGTVALSMYGTLILAGLLAWIFMI